MDNFLFQKNTSIYFLSLMGVVVILMSLNLNYSIKSFKVQKKALKPATDEKKIKVDQEKPDVDIVTKESENKKEDTKNKENN